MPQYALGVGVLSFLSLTSFINRLRVRFVQYANVTVTDSVQQQVARLCSASRYASSCWNSCYVPADPVGVISLQAFMLQAALTREHLPCVHPLPMMSSLPAQSRRCYCQLHQLLLKLPGVAAIKVRPFVLQGQRFAFVTVSLCFGPCTVLVMLFQG